MNFRDSRFAVAPSEVYKNRSRFDMPYRHLTTANFGQLVPFYVNEVLPGDSFKVNTQMFSRMSTPLYPVMDNAFIDYYYFFVPNRLVWSRWAEFLGENKLSAWNQPVDYIVPHAEVVSSPGSVYDHMGIPTYSADVDSGQSGSIEADINMLPLRSYHLIWNEWFRNENTTDPVLVNTGDGVSSSEVSRFQTLLNVSKPFDYFTAALPQPQKGDAVDIPMIGDVPVVTAAVANADSGYPLHFHTQGHSQTVGSAVTFGGVYAGVNTAYSDSTVSITKATNVGGGSGDLNVTMPSNLMAKTSEASAVTINQLRQAFQMQRLLELQARSGTRYTEIIRASFGVVSPDARLQRPEFLGGTRVAIQMQQVTQTSSTDTQSPLGHTGAYSKTVCFHKDFTASFTEHGFIIGVLCARHKHTYQQGLHKMWSRRGRYDYYWPTFAHIGEQPILNKELLLANDGRDDEVFGYQEAWAEYRFKPNECSGAFRSTVSNNLDEWHYADYYRLDQARPVLSAGWMAANDVSVDRTLAVSSDLHDQLLFDIQVNAVVDRVMPLYSIPGLIDHF